MLEIIARFMQLYINPIRKKTYKLPFYRSWNVAQSRPLAKGKGCRHQARVYSTMLGSLSLTEGTQHGSVMGILRTRLGSLVPIYDLGRRAEVFSIKFGSLAPRWYKRCIILQFILFLMVNNSSGTIALWTELCATWLIGDWHCIFSIKLFLMKYDTVYGKKKFHASLQFFRYFLNYFFYNFFYWKNIFWVLNNEILHR